MWIESIETIPIRVPLQTVFETSFGRFSDRNVLYVRVVTTSGEAISECPVFGPYYSSETTKTVAHVIADYIAPKLIGTQIVDIEDYLECVAFIRGHEMARSAVEHALWDLLAREDGIPLYRKLGGVRSEIPVGISIGVKESVADLYVEIEEALDRGFKRVKLKIQPGWDLDVTKAVRERFPDIPLMVDANGVYSLRDQTLFQHLDRLSLMMIEQPLEGSDLYGHAVLQEQLKTPICLDESIHSLYDVEAAIALGSCRIINIKPFRVGGLYEAKRIQQFCGEHDVGVWCGGMVETGVGRAINLAAASLPSFNLPSDIAPTLDRFVDDAICPALTMTKEGMVRIPNTAGLGFEVSREFIRAYKVS